MTNDLSDAHEALDWSVAQIKVLSQRISTWNKSRPYEIVVEPDSDPRHEIVKARLVGESAPRVINAEAGAIINMIRSSLDMLFTTLADRSGAISSGAVREQDLQFPIVKTKVAFNATLKKITWLAKAELMRIENLKPYEGGDKFLWPLHRLDIFRKHRRLIRAVPRLRKPGISRVGHHPEAINIFGGALEDGTPLWKIPRGTHGQTKLAIDIAFAEASVSDRWPAREALKAFSERAREVVNLFGLHP